MAEEFPVVLCVVTDSGDWKFWCPFCRAFHVHGRGPGHRVGHCHTEEGKAAFPRGYILTAQNPAQAQRSDG